MDQNIYSAITAFSTIALVIATLVLAWLTKYLADSSYRSSVVVYIESHQEELMFAELKIVNEGNASAYDVNLSFDPPLPDSGGQFDEIKYPKNISLLVSQQKVVTALCEGHILADQKYKVAVSWLNSPESKKRKAVIYPFDLSHMKNVSKLGHSPEYDSAKVLKKIERSLVQILEGRKRLEVNSYDADDRLEAKRKQDEWLAAQRQKDT